MPISQRIIDLIQRPAESLNVEIKTWIDPRTDEGIGKLVKGIFAIRNRNGGYMAIGFDNGTLTPDAYPYADDVEAVFHIDVIQGALSRYANKPFEVTVDFPELAGQRHPVITIPEGVVIPAVIKGDLVRQPQGHHLRKGEIYFRTLNANGTASSAVINARDIEDLMTICFDNREADIGRFLRRQLGSADLSALGSLISGLAGQAVTPAVDPALEALESSDAAFQIALTRQPAAKEIWDGLNKLTMQAVMVLSPPHEGQPTQEFMNKIAGGNPQYTGWPVWLDSRNSNNADFRAYVRDGGWETLITDPGGWVGPHYEFTRLDPRGVFYLRRVMQDDLTDKVAEGTALDVVLMLYRVTEVIAVGISLARALGWDEADRARFAFRWTGLENRRLASWVNVLRSIGFGGHYASATPTIESVIELALDTPHAALAPHVAGAIQPLLAAFNGYEASTAIIEEAVRSLVERDMKN